MVKGVSIKFKSFEESAPKILELIKLGDELKKYERIVIKPRVVQNKEDSSDVRFVEQIVKFCVANKNPGAGVSIAEGVDGENTMELFEEQGYKQLAETHGASLVDLNKTQCDSIGSNDFVGFESIMYPSILKDSFVISMPSLRENDKTQFTGALANMLGAFPSEYYRGFFSSSKTKIRKFPIKYAIHDVLKVKVPQFAVIDASEKGEILAGIPFDMDKQGTKLLGKDPKAIQYLRLIEQSFNFDIPQKSEEKTTPKAIK